MTLIVHQSALWMIFIAELECIMIDYVHLSNRTVPLDQSYDSYFKV